MKQLLVATLAFVAVAQAEAKVLNADLSLIKDKSDREMASVMCLLKLNVDPTKNVAEQVIAQLRKSDKPVKLKQIESSQGSISGGGGLQGDYLTRVYIVGRDGYDGAYKFGIFEAITVTQFGKRGTNELNGLEVDVNRLNYKNSAELGEDYMCDQLTYK